MSLTTLLLLLAAPGQSDKWEKDIAAFEQEDREKPPPAEGILFAGSSSIRMWDLKKAFPDLPTINRGFGGSQIGDSVRYADRIILPARPKAVVLYAGGNDVAGGKTPETVFADYQAFVKKVHDALPKTRVWFISLKSTTKRWALDKEMRRVNELIEAHAKTDPRLGFIDAAPFLRNPDGTPRDELFKEDRLHLNERGYAVWNAVVGPALRGEVRLLVRADDMGAAQGINEGCFRALRDGIARSVEVIVPGPWFPQAARMLKELPDVDVGVHLCLTSEWENAKWRPLTRAPSLVDADGYFFPMTRQRKDFPPGTGFLENKPKPEEVEAELRAQIEAARKHLPRLTHLSAHMGTAVATPELRAVVQKLAAEYGLPLEARGLGRVTGWGGNRLSADEKEKAFLEILSKLQPGTWLFVEHPAADSPEMRALSHTGYTNVAEDRAGVLRVFTSDAVKAALRDRGIKLIRYADLPR